jgi:outer membrane protein, heavy metal efflux system
MRLENLSQAATRATAVALLCLGIDAPMNAERQQARPGPAPMTVEELTRSALDSNRELRAVREEIAVASGAMTQSRLRPNPGVDVTFETGRPFGSAGERVFEAGYAHTFEMGGKRDRRIDVAQVGIEIAELEAADRERQLRADVGVRFAETLAARRNVDVLQELTVVTDRASRAVEQRVAEGEAAPVERALLQVETGRLKADRLLSTSAASRAAGALRLTAGLPAGGDLPLSGDLRLPPITSSVDDAITFGLEHRPDLLVARAVERQAGAERALARAERTPDVIGLARYSNSQSQFDQFGTNGAGQVVPLTDHDHTLTLGVSIPLPFANRNQGHLEITRARESAATLRRQFLEDTVRTEIRAAYDQYLATRDALDAFDASVINQAQDALKTIRVTYDLGEMPLLDLLQEYRRLVDTQKAYTDILREHYVARARLSQAIGAEVK